MSVENLAKTYDGNLKIAYEDYLNSLAHKGILSNSRFRSKALRAANPDFPILFKKYPNDSIEIGVHQDDKKSWAIVSWMSQRGLLHWNTVSLLRPESTYDIFKSIYSFQHREALPESFGDIEKHVANHPLLLEKWTVERIPITGSDAVIESSTSHSTVDKFALHPKSTNLKRWPREEPYTDQNGEYTDKWLKYMLGTEYPKQAVEGILENICMLPFADLNETSKFQMDQAGINRYIPFMEKGNFTRLQWMTWKPIIQTAMGAHLLYTEDEVYQYCLLNNWYFPDLLCNKEALFAIRPIERAHRVF